MRAFACALLGAVLVGGIAGAGVGFGLAALVSARGRSSGDAAYVVAVWTMLFAVCAGLVGSVIGAAIGARFAWRRWGLSGESPAITGALTLGALGVGILVGANVLNSNVLRGWLHTPMALLLVAFIALYAIVGARVASGVARSGR